MQKILTHLLFQHRFDGLEIIGQIGAVNICFLLHPHDRADFAVLGLIHHHEGLLDVALLQSVYLPCDLRCQILVFKLTAAGIGIDHQTAVHHGVLVL